MIKLILKNKKTNPRTIFMKQKQNTGFTLIELLVVISIIGLLSSVVLTSLNDARAKARDTKKITELKELQSALALYFSENEEYPPHTPINSWSSFALAKYTNISGDTTEVILKNAMSPYMQHLPIGGTFQNPDKNNNATSRILYSLLTQNTVPGCSNIKKNCYALIVYPEANSIWGNANTVTYFLSNGEIRQGFDVTLY